MDFQTEEGLVVPAVTAEQMRKVDRIAVEDFGLGILQMMENADRNLAQHVMAMLDGETPGQRRGITVHRFIRTTGDV